MNDTIRDTNRAILTKLTDEIGYSADWILDQLVDHLNSMQVSEFLEDLIKKEGLESHF
jgi:hypothetical protein